jgi:hypothetical protein
MQKNKTKLTEHNIIPVLLRPMQSHDFTLEFQNMF